MFKTDVFLQVLNTNHFEGEKICKIDTQINNYFRLRKRSLLEFHKALSMDHYCLIFLIGDPVLFLTQYFLNNYADDNNLYTIVNNLE